VRSSKALPPMWNLRVGLTTHAKLPAHVADEMFQEEVAASRTADASNISVRRCEFRDCHRVHYALGQCRKHYQRLYRKHRRRDSPM
jgi:hypothetical protein